MQSYVKSFFLPRETLTFFTKYCKISIGKWKKAKLDRLRYSIQLPQLLNLTRLLYCIVMTVQLHRHDNAIASS
jgi:hypothetical protein